MSNKDYYRIDFDKLVETLTQASAKAQVTFLYKFIMCIGPSMCRTIIRYCYERLDRINVALPDTDPNKVKFLERLEQHKTFLTKDEIKNLTDPWSFLPPPNKIIRFQEDEKL